MTEQLDLEDWLRENPANSDDTRKTDEMVISKMENTTQTNNDDTNYYLLELDDMVIALENKDAVIKELEVDIITLSKELQDEIFCKEFIEKEKEQLEDENQQLKELLKECRVYVENCEQFNAYDFEMLKTIDNAIGEKNNGN